jgi:hypothetical protein
MNIELAFNKLCEDLQVIETAMVSDANKTRSVSRQTTAKQFIEMKDFLLQLIIFILEQKMGEVADVTDLPRKKK